MRQALCVGIMLLGWAASPGAALQAAAAEEPDALEALRRKLGSADFAERQEAREKLNGRVEQFYLQLAAGLASEDPVIRAETEKVLKAVWSRIGFAELLCRMAVADRPRLRDLRLAHPAIFDQLTSDLPDFRKKGCLALAEVKDPLVVPVLVAMTLDTHPQVLRFALKALGKAGSVEALPRLIAWAENPADPASEAESEEVQMAKMINPTGGSGKDVDGRPVHQIATEAIGAIQHPRAAEYLIGKLEKPDPETLPEIMTALAQTGQADLAVPAFMLLIGDARTLAQLELDRRGLPGQFQLRGKVGMVQVMGGNEAPKGDGVKVLEATVGDLALGSIVNMTGQNGDDYGLVKGDTGFESNWRNPTDLSGVKCFKSVEARQQATAKLKAWYEGWAKRDPAKEQSEPPGDKKTEP